MNKLFFLFGIFLGVLGLLIILSNYYIVIINKYKQKHISLIPIAGGLSSFLSIILLSNLSFSYWFLLLFFIDIGSAWLIYYFFKAITTKNRKKFIK